jgi:proteasome lid subunit RPN8/RPN11
VTIKEIVFSKDAWDKLLYLRDKGDTEIGGWGVTADDDEFFVEDFFTVKQKCTSVTVEFDDADNNRFATDMLIKKNKPHKNTQKIWIHTHPGNSPKPSSVDEETLKKMVENLSVDDYIVMFIIAKDSSTYCRLSLKTKFGIMTKELKCSYCCVENKDWEKEYDDHVEKKPAFSQQIANGKTKGIASIKGKGYSYDYSDVFELSDREDNFLSERFNMLPDVSSRGTSLQEADLPEEVYLKFDVESVKDLKPNEIKYLKKLYGKSVNIYLEGLEQCFSDSEILLANDISEIYETYKVDSLEKLTKKQWREVLRQYHVRKKAALVHEQRYLSSGIKL